MNGQIVYARMYKRARLQIANHLQGKAAENHCVTTTKYISTSLALAARITLSITRISKVSL